MGNPQPQQQPQMQQQQDGQLQGPHTSTHTAVLPQVDQPHRLQSPRSNPVGPPRAVTPSQVEALGGPPGGHPPQCQLNAGTLALFAPSIRTPPPRRHSANFKGEWSGPPPSELSRHTPSTSSRTRHAGDRRIKGPTPASEELNQLMDTANQSPHPSAARKNTRGAQAETSRPQQQQREHNQPQMQQLEGQLGSHPQADNTGSAVEREASGNPNTSTPSIVISPPESFVGSRAPSLSQLQDHGSSPATAADQLQQISSTILGATATAAPHSSEAFREVQGDLLSNPLPGPPEEKRHAQQQQQKGPRGASGRSRRGRKRRECGARREPSGHLPSIGEPLGPTESLPQTASNSQGLGADDGTRCWGGLSYCGIPLKPLRASHILELSPLLLAKVLQLLPVGSAAAFGSTCWRARRVLLSYSCIVSLSARNVSSLLSLPPAALKRQLPFLSGLKSLEIELTSAVSPPLFLGAAAAAAAAAAVAAAGSLLRPADAGYEQVGINNNTWNEQVHTPRGTRGERRQQQQRTASSSRQQQTDQQEGGHEGQRDATAGRVAAVPSLSRLSWAYGLVQGRALEFLRVQPTLPGPTAAAGEAQPPAATPPSPPSPWTTYTAANASPLLNSLCHLKSLSAKLKLSPTGTHGDAQASTELLLLLQMLLHRNAHSLVSIKIAVDLSASSVRLPYLDVV
ncbi:hypothetical protein, conserved [Eimeria brunetti]|uniref:F-box domain-containing protein n=1 Tax=Eimeria brunetti TaxID=51314 RepID=U6LMM5_9EIME|nr:hypothetical protein, conserved [Eimeria brunetti]